MSFRPFIHPFVRSSVIISCYSSVLKREGGGLYRIWVVCHSVHLFIRPFFCHNFSFPPGVLGIWGEWLFIFRELGSTGNYFQGFWEQAHSFVDLGSPAKK